MKSLTTKQIINIATAAKVASGYGVMDAETTVAQIGRMNVAAISGGRVLHTDNAIVMPVSNGYYVVVELDVNDTYTVYRVFVRNGQATIKGEWSDIYCDQIGEVAYQASCFR